MVCNNDAVGDILVGRKIRHRRWQLGETQLEFAEKLGVTYRDVQLYESGVRKISTQLLEKIAAVQSRSLSYYLS